MAPALPLNTHGRRVAVPLRPPLHNRRGAPPPPPPLNGLGVGGKLGGSTEGQERAAPSHCACAPRHRPAPGGTRGERRASPRPVLTKALPAPLLSGRGGKGWARARAPPHRRLPPSQAVRACARLPPRVAALCSSAPVADCGTARCLPGA